MTRQRDTGLLALWTLRLVWLDVNFGIHLVQGFPAAGHHDWSGVLTRREVSPSERCDIFTRSCRAQRAGPGWHAPWLHDEVVWQQSLRRKLLAPLRQAKLETASELELGVVGVVLGFRGIKLSVRSDSFRTRTVPCSRATTLQHSSAPLHPAPPSARE